MRDEEFIAQVQARTGFSSREEAERGARATIDLLGKELPHTMVGPLAELLPDELGSRLRDTASAGSNPPPSARGVSSGPGIARGEGSWPGDESVSGQDVDAWDGAEAGPE